MALYFLVHESNVFEGEIRPALAASWRQRSFEPCRAVCDCLLPAAMDFAARFHLGQDEPLLAQVAGGVPFDRVLWQHLAGELIWFGAVDIPELQTNLPALLCLLAPDAQWPSATARSELAPIIQAHHGSRDLRFGGGGYRPLDAGFNNEADVARLAAYLAGIQPETWQIETLAKLPDLMPEDREEELEFLRDWFGPLQSLYTTAAAKGRVVICETLE